MCGSLRYDWYDQWPISLVRRNFTHKLSSGHWYLEVECAFARILQTWKSHWGYFALWDIVTVSALKILNSVHPSLTRCLLLYRWVLWADPQQMLGNATKYICRWPEHMIRITHINYIYIYIHIWSMKQMSFQHLSTPFNTETDKNHTKVWESPSWGLVDISVQLCGWYWFLVLRLSLGRLGRLGPLRRVAKTYLAYLATFLDAVSCWTESKVQRFLVNIQLWLVYKVRQPWAHLRIFGYFAHLSHNHQCHASKIREALSRQAR